MYFFEIVFVVVVLVGCGVYYRFTLMSSFAKKLNQFPGPKIFPFVGNFVHLFLLNGGMPYNHSTWLKKYGKNIRFWNFHLPYLCTTDLEVVEKVLSSHMHTEKSYEYRVSRFFMGNGIVTSTGPRWKRDRKLLAPTWGKGMTDTFVKLVNQHSVQLMNALEKEFQQNSQEKDIRVHFGRCTGDIITEFIRDDKLNLQTSDNPLPAVEAMFTILESLAARVYKPWILLPLVRHLTGLRRVQTEAMKVIHQAIPKEMIQRAVHKWRPIGVDMAEGKDVPEQPTKALHVLGAAGLSEKELFYQLTSLTGAGADTTASAVTGICFLLATHPIVQDKVRVEVYSIIGEYRFNRDITQDHLKQMSYLESTVKECLRIITAAPVFGRRIGRDIILNNGKVIPKGTNVEILASKVHADPDNYVHPEKFIPERFLPENSVGRNPYSYLPFSSGPRSCLGQHLGMIDLKMVVARIVLWFELHTTKRVEDVEWQGIVASPHGGLPLSLRKLKKLKV